MGEADWSKRLAVASVVAMAAATPLEAAELEEVVVTAQKKQESVQDTPVAVSALAGDELTQRNIVNVQDFNAVAPNVTFGELNGFARVNIRGIGNQNFFTGGDPSVSMYIDGAVIAQAAAQMMAFFDIDRIEVVRGPQGTLYGRNATGGSINLITRKPTPTFTGDANLTLGNYDLFKFEGAVGGPVIGDRVLGRLAISRQSRNGFGVNEFTNKDINDLDRIYARGQLLFPGEAQELLLSFEYGKEDDSNYQLQVFRQANPGPAGRPTGVLLGGTQAIGERNINSEADLKNDRETFSATANYQWDISDTLGFRSITNYRKYDHYDVFDIDGTQIYYADVEQIIESKQYSEELQLNWEQEQLSLVGGLYYFHEDLFGDNNLGPSRPPPVGPPGIFDTSLVGDVDVDAVGVFTQGTYRLNDRIGLTLGVRYSDETREGDGTFRGPTTITPPVATPRKISADNISAKAGVDWHLTEQLMTYASFSQGFKSGVILVGSSDPVAKPELVDAYEVGFKGQFLERRLQSNVAAFFYDYQDLQITQLLQGASVPSITNAGSAEIWGVEAELVAIVAERLRIDAKAGYLDATFKELISRNPRVAPPAPSPELDLSGNTLPYAPEWTADLRLEYSLPLSDLRISEGGTVTLSGEAVYTDNMTFSIFNEADLSQPANTIYNASLRFDTQSEAASLSLWVKNLSDEYTFGNLTVGGGLSSNRNIYGVLTPPRTYGVSFAYKF